MSSNQLRHRGVVDAPLFPRSDTSSRSSSHHTSAMYSAPKFCSSVHQTQPKLVIKENEEENIRKLDVLFSNKDNAKDYLHLKSSNFDYQEANKTHFEFPTELITDLDDPTDLIIDLDIQKRDYEEEIEMKNPADKATSIEFEDVVDRIVESLDSSGSRTGNDHVAEKNINKQNIRGRFTKFVRIHNGKLYKMN
jgi:hypothetical protein